LRGFGFARVDDDDIGVPFVTGEALVEDGVGDGEIGSDEDDGVRFFEVGVGVGGGVEAEGLFVGDDGGGHALAGVAVAVFNAHAEFGEGAEESHFFGRNLSGGDKGNGVFAVFFLDFLEGVAEDFGREVPGDFLGFFVWPIPEKGGGGAFFGVETAEGFPAFGAGHAEVNGVASGGGEADGFAFVEVEVELAAGRAETADGGGGGIGGEVFRELPEAVVVGFEEELFGEWAGFFGEGFVDELFEVRGHGLNGE